MRAAVIADGIVTNVIIVESEQDAQAFGATICPPHVNIGYRFQDDVWTEPPPEEEPQE